jgi:hypothetical protein
MVPVSISTSQTLAGLIGFEFGSSFVASLSVKG